MKRPDEQLPNNWINSPSNRLVLSLLLFGLFGIIFSQLNIPATDWRGTFYPVSKNIGEPYAIQSFLNPPWITFFLFPFSFFSENISLVINASLTVVICWMLLQQKQGKLLSILLTFTSFPFISLIGNGNIEWVTALGLMFPNSLGAIILLTKPQATIFILADWYQKQEKKLTFVAIPFLWVIISLLIWPDWPIEMYANVRSNLYPNANMSLFPWTVPVGIGLVIYLLRYKPKDGELVGSLASICFTPYFAPHSLIIPFILLSARYPRVSIAIWVMLWCYIIFI